ncbi:hypothetical protein IKE79_01440 [Candidatus Saccharibacteria bacterium]|nr:hypothetical protein [Candidatus Saccharibacteria bacterium]
MNNKVQLFENQPVRHEWDAEKEEWLFSVVDVVGVLIEQPDYDAARKYWKVLKGRLKEEGSELVTNCYQLKMKSLKDGKGYLTDVMTTEQILRLVQSIPSKKAEPFKLWLGNSELATNCHQLGMSVTMMGWGEWNFLMDGMRQGDIETTSRDIIRPRRAR